LVSAGGLATYTTAWASQTLMLSNQWNDTDAAAIRNQTGTVLAAFGPIANNDGSGGTRIYYVKNITLENADGSKVVKALSPDSPLLWGGNGAAAYLNQGGNDIVVRELFVEDVP